MVKIPFFSRKPTISKEYSEAQAQLKQAVKNMTRGWKNKFIDDIYNEQTLYPHDEMKIARKIVDYNSHVGAAVDTLADFLVGGDVKVVVDGSDMEQKKVENFVNTTGLFNNIDLAFKDLIAFGNHYEERIFQNGEVIYYDPVPTPEFIYHILNEKGVIKKFFVELPPEYIQGSNFQTIKYYGDKRKTIKGYAVNKEDIFFIKIGVSSIPSYGRGAVPRIVNDYKILVEIERALAVISRYKAIPKKLISLIEASPFELEQFATQISMLSDWENPITNKDLKVEDLSYSGKDFNFQPYIDYLKRKMTASLAPEYVIHGEDTNRATSKEQQKAFLLRVKAIRSKVKKFYIEEISRWTGIPKTKIDIEFGTLDIGQAEEKKAFILNAWNSGLLKLNEAREELGYEPEKSEIGDMYSFELKNAPQEINPEGEAPEGQ